MTLAVSQYLKDYSDENGIDIKKFKFLILYDNILKIYTNQSIIIFQMTMHYKMTKRCKIHLKQKNRPLDFNICNDRV